MQGTPAAPAASQGLAVPVSSFQRLASSRSASSSLAKSRAGPEAGAAAGLAADAARTAVGASVLGNAGADAGAINVPSGVCKATGSCAPAVATPRRSAVGHPIISATAAAITAAPTNAATATRLTPVTRAKFAVSNTSPAALSTILRSTMACPPEGRRWRDGAGCRRPSLPRSARRDESARPRAATAAPALAGPASAAAPAGR